MSGIIHINLNDNSFFWHLFKHKDTKIKPDLYKMKP